MAQALVRFLSAQRTERDGVEHRFIEGCFGIFGHGNLTGVGQALAQNPELLTYYQARNEQAMVHTAAGFARMRNRLAALACTTSIGPGATNMVTGAAAATVNRVPVLLLPGDVFASRRPDPVLQQLETPSRGDASVSTFFGVQSGLAMTSILVCGSEEQRQEWLPQLARLEKIGAFGLTEPEIGSDAAHLRTTARRDGDSYVINGAKRWIGNATFADVVVVWAREAESGQVNAFLVEKGTPGYEAQLIEGKLALRSVWNGHLTFKDARIPASNRLANSRDFRDTARVLTITRSGVACGAIGAAVACYEAALAYATQRQQFGKPIAAFQMVQQKLVWMLAEITSMQLAAVRLGQLFDAGKMTPEQAALAKLNNAAKARKIAADARDIMGGNGILLENIVARHQADMEAIFTYEGTDHVQTLVVGRKITGIAAFA